MMPKFLRKFGLFRFIITGAIFLVSSSGKTGFKFDPKIGF